MGNIRARRWGAGKAAATRWLYEVAEPVTQVDLAAHACVSQPAVSQYLVSLRSRGDVVFANPGWLPVREQLPASYHACYSSRLTEQAPWYRIDDVAAQVSDLIESEPDVIVSGDVAADVVRPWRVPSIAVVYGDIDSTALGDLGFVQADSAGAASVVIRSVPDDRFRSQASRVNDMLIAPRLHVVADLLDLGGADRVEAAARFAECGELRPLDSLV